VVLDSERREREIFALDRSPDLLVKKSRSHGLAWVRDGSFCNSSCDLAAQGDQCRFFGGLLAIYGLSMLHVPLLQ
jgi:hypothetical protein